MTVTIEDQAVESLETLRKQAAERGISFSRYLEILANNNESILASGRSPHKLSIAEFSNWLEDLSKGMPDVPPLPADFSRADLYDDHD